MQSGYLDKLTAYFLPRVSSKEFNITLLSFKVPCSSPLKEKHWSNSCYFQDKKKKKKDLIKM